ncbi:MAG: BamA/TamA family outer membrane protein, partial [bacterium]
EQYRASIGFGIRHSGPALSPVPLAFDFGVPIKNEETDDKDVFSFSLDVPFR